MSRMMSVERVPDRSLRRIAWVVNIAFLALLCSELARVTWQLIVPAQPILSVPIASATTNDSARNALRASALFGRSTLEPQTSAPIGGLILSGVVAAGRSSVALISVGGATAEPYFIGEEIANGITLHAATADHVLVRRETRIDRLDMAGRDDTQASPGLSESAPSSAVEQIAPNRFALSRGLAEAQLRSPEFLRQAMMVPQAEGGFLVREITAGSLYEKLGLRSGDVIRTVNGSPVNNLEDAMQLYRRLGSAGQVQIEITRGGRVETLEYTIR